MFVKQDSDKITILSGHRTIANSYVHDIVATGQWCGGSVPIWVECESTSPKRVKCNKGLWNLPVMHFKALE